MNDHRLVEALRARGSGALAAVHDAHADRLYAYCWFQLLSRDAAQVALRDTFIIAEAHIGRLRDPDRLAPWLYAIARLECARRLPAGDQPPDTPVASHDQEDVDQRIIAWQAVRSLPPASREVLELRVRHRLSVPELAAILDLPLQDAQASLDGARGELEQALTGEMLAHQGPYGCAERAALLRERHEVPVPARNGRLTEHAQGCSVCGAFRPRTVSTAKVYGMLPDVDPPAELRLRVMSCFLDPELAGYRRLVAARVAAFTPDGFPAQAPERARPAAEPGRDGRSWLRRRRVKGVPSKEPGRTAQALRIGGVLTVVGLLSGGGIAAMHGLFDTGRPAADTAAGPSPRAGGTGQSRESLSPDRPDGTGRLDAAPVSATFPLGAMASSAPPAIAPNAAPESLPADAGSEPGAAERAASMLVASPLYLDLAGGSDGSVRLRAAGAPVTWRAETEGALRVRPSSGHLEAGESATVRVRVSRRKDSNGEGAITFAPGGSRVQVTWRPDAPAPDPAPDPTPTDPGPGDPSAPPPTQRPDDPRPSPSTPPSSSEPPPSDEPNPTPSTAPSAPPTTTPSGTGTASSA